MNSNNFLSPKEPLPAQKFEYKGPTKTVLPELIKGVSKQSMVDMFKNELVI